MTRFAIDPPTLVRLATGSEEVRPEHQLVAPNSIRSLALDLLLDKVRNHELSESAALEAHERMTELKMRVLGDRVSRRTAWRMAVDTEWDSIQDAEYLAVAKLQADALITSNPELVARAKGVVPLAKVKELFEK
jgi:predicted nucleic acid-binding protein